jgi:hypothetical protein
MRFGSDVDGVLDDAGVGGAAGGLGYGDPAEDGSAAGFEGDVAMLAEPGGIECSPSRGCGLEGGVAGSMPAW